MSIKRFTTTVAAAVLLGTGLATAPIGTAPAANAADVETCDHQTMFTIFFNDKTAQLMRYDNANPGDKATWTSSRKVSESPEWMNMKKLTVDNSNSQRRILAIKEGGADDGTLYAWNYNLTGGDITGPIAVGNGFNNVRLMTSSEGYLYTVSTDGNLRRYAFDRMSGRYAGGGVVGNGWNTTTALAGGRKGAIYASRNDGTLHWYRDNIFTGRAGFDHTLISNRWNGISQMTGGGNGILYGFAPNQTQLIRYTYDGDATGNGGVTQQGLGSYYHHIEFAADPTACGNVVDKPKPPTQNASFGIARPGSAGDITSPFGWRIHPITGERQFHTGQDYGKACDTPLLAVADGTVIKAGWDGGYGNRIEIDHGTFGGANFHTLYAHMSGFAVTSGPVKRGQVIGYTGTTGSSTGCHLHFEVIRNGEAVNPEGYYK